MACSTTTHLLTGEAAFYLVYRKYTHLPIALIFNDPSVQYLVVATEYAKVLAVELKRARAAAKNNFQRYQRDQRNQIKHYDQQSKECDL